MKGLRARINYRYEYNYVRSFQVHYSDDGMLWKSYKIDGKNAVTSSFNLLRQISDNITFAIAQS